MLRLVSSLFIAALTAISAVADNLILLHTNDTHSQIDPNDSGLGGIMRRKALIDSIRAAEPNVILIDAGDAVQGTLFFNLYKGEVEYRLLDELGYDYAVLGNHDFDNGAEALFTNLLDTDVCWLTTNYDLSESPLDDIFVPYDIKEIEGRRIGFMGLNLQPKGMISEGNYNGVRYLDAYKAANATAWSLKHNEGVDLVVAITHIGYDGEPGPRDIPLAEQSEDIDIIIGGHSHTTVSPNGKDEYRTNAAGKRVLVVQTGSRGANLGQITIDLDDLSNRARLLPVTSRYDKSHDSNLAAFIAPYRHAVDSIMNRKIARTVTEVSDTRMLNMVADFVARIGRSLTADGIDMAIVNKGGIRRSFPKGDVTEGMVMTAFPFNNRVQVLQIKGGDLRAALDVMARRGGDGVSREADITFDPSTGRTETVLISGKPLADDAVYNIATIDYLARGGDYMFPLTEGEVIATSDNVLYQDLIDILSKTKKRINPDANLRMRMNVE